MENKATILRYHTMKKNVGARLCTIVDFELKKKGGMMHFRARVLNMVQS